MLIELLVVRHGNTFLPGETPRRVGCRTDLPLVEQEKAKAVGRFLRREGFMPDWVLSSPLKRTRETAEIALATADYPVAIELDERFVEVDYGPDENQIEAAVLQRIGAEALSAWDEQAVVPPDWVVDPEQIMQAWQQLGRSLQARAEAVSAKRSKAPTDVESAESAENFRAIVFTSNGIARFAPILSGAIDAFKRNHQLPHLKVATGSVSWFYKNCEDPVWQAKLWNHRP